MAITRREEPPEITAVLAAAPSLPPELIPGLPDEIAEHCMLHLPFPYQTLARSVSSSWNRAISSPTFLRAKKYLSPSLSLPYLFVFAFHPSTSRLQWQAFDPRSRRWFVLPPMPVAGGCGAAAALCPAAFATAAIPRRGELFVLGGMRSDTQTALTTLLSYRASTNSWSVAAPMPTPRSFFVAGTIGGKIFAAGGSSETGDGGGGAICSVECYDPAADRWAPAARMRWGMTRYDAAVVGEKLYVTEGWRWPFSFSPRGGVYDAAADSWEEMPVGMREGWTGVSVVLGEKLFAISEYGDCRVKVYEEGRDTWQCVGGGGVPSELRKPFAVAGIDGRIYVVASGLDIGVGTVVGGGAAAGGGGVAAGGGKWCVEWEVVKGPKAFADLEPSDSQVLYA